MNMNILGLLGFKKKRAEALTISRKKPAQEILKDAAHFERLADLAREIEEAIERDADKIEARRKDPGVQRHIANLNRVCERAREILADTQGKYTEGQRRAAMQILNTPIRELTQIEAEEVDAFFRRIEEES